MFGEKSILRSWLLQFIVTVILITSMSVSAVPPSWWSQSDSNGRKVTAPAGGVPNNYGPANIGQAKFMAKRAIQALRLQAPSVADAIEGDLVGPGKIILNWNVPVPGSDTAKEQYSPLRIGQLKSIADPFYTRLNAYKPVWLNNQLRLNRTLDGSNSANFFPWTDTETDDVNQAIATVGQLKNVFSLRFESLNDPSVPLNTGIMPRLSVAGNLLVKVTNPNGSPMSGVRLEFNRMSGDGGFPGSITNTTRTTDALGLVSAGDYISPLGDVIRVTLHMAQGSQTVWLPANVSAPDYTTREGAGNWNYVPPMLLAEGGREPEVQTQTDPPVPGPIVESFGKYLEYEATYTRKSVTDIKAGGEGDGSSLTTIESKLTANDTVAFSRGKVDEGAWTAWSPVVSLNFISPWAINSYSTLVDDEVKKETDDSTSKMSLKANPPAGYRMETEIGYNFKRVVNSFTTYGVHGREKIVLNGNSKNILTSTALVGGVANNGATGVTAAIGPFISSGPGTYGGSVLTWDELDSGLVMMDPDSIKYLTAEVFTNGDGCAVPGGTGTTKWKIHSSDPDVWVCMVGWSTEGIVPNVTEMPEESSDEKKFYAIQGFKIRRDPDASINARSTITLSMVNDNGQTVVEKTFKVAMSSTSQNDSPSFRHGENPLSSTMPIEESSGPKYRKIALNGRPISDEKPQREGETDEEDEETYVDALSRELHHSTTDIYVPVPGSDLALTVRRNASSEIWNPTSGLLPKEDPTLVFGPAWRSNLGAHIKIIEQLVRPPDGTEGLPIEGSDLVAKVSAVDRRSLGVSQTDPNYAFVTDENGSSYRFLIGYLPTSENDPVSRFYVPAPTSVNEKEAYEMSLVSSGGNLIFKKQHGNTLVFQNCIRFKLDRIRRFVGSPGGQAPGITEGEQPLGMPEEGTAKSGLNGSSGAKGGGQLQDYRYLRLVSVTDRLGTQLKYDYLGGEDIIPAKISVADRPELEIHIQASDGKVNSVFDPNGNETRYEYATSGGVLSKVWSGPDLTTTYGYKRWYEEDPKKYVVSSNGTSLLSWADAHPEKIQYEEVMQHIDLSSITDAALNTVAFTYKQDKSHRVMASSRFASLSSSSILTDEGECSQTYAAAGYPPDVTKIDLPGGGVVKIGNSSDVPAVPFGSGGNLSDFQRHTTVLDAAGHRRTYSWPASVSVKVNQLELGYVDELSSTSGGISSLRAYKAGDDEPIVYANDSGSTAMYTYFTKMMIEHDSGGSEIFTFNPLAGCALKSVVDFSGNTTRYFHGGGTDSESGTLFLPQKMGGITPLYRPKPTSQSDTLGRITKYAYGNLEMLQETTDYIDRTQNFGVDFMGRTTREVMTTSDARKLSDTEIVYDSDAPGTGKLKTGIIGGFPGFISRRTVKSAGVFVTSADPVWAKPLTQLYVPDARGRVAQQATDMDGSNTINAGDLITSFTYDRNGNKLSETNPSGLTTWFHYDTRNRLIGVTYPDGTEKKTIYDVRGKKVLEYDEKGIASGSVYDPRGRLIKTVHDMNGNLTNTATGLAGIDSGVDLITEMAYNQVDSVTQVKDARGYVYVTEYDYMQRPVKKITPGPTWPAGSAPVDSNANQVTSLFYNGANSGASCFDVSSFKPTKIVDPRGYTSIFLYDQLYRSVGSRVQYSLSPALFASTSSEYGDGFSPVVTKVTEERTPVFANGVIAPGAVATAAHVVDTEYDGLYRPIKVSDSDSETKSEYTATGLVKKTTRKLTATVSAVTDMEYDRAGRLAKTIAPSVPLDGTTTMVRPETSTVYSPTGSVIQTVDGRGNSTQFIYDARERLLQTIAPTVYDAESQQNNRPSLTTSTYDNVGNVTRVTNPRGFSTLTSYDAANRAVQVTLPTYWEPLTQLNVTPTTVNEYDLAGNPVKVTDANGSVTLNTYDPLGRVVTTKTNATVPATTSSHADDQIVAFAWDKVGNKIKVTDGLNQVTSFEYDGKNRLTATIWDSDDTTRRKVESTEYDGLVATATVNSRPIRTEYSYNNRLLLTGSTCAQIPDDNETRTYDNAGRLLTVKRTDANDLRNVTYNYDAQDKVTSETSAGSTHSYGYDRIGNRTVVQYSTNRKLATIYDSQNRVTTIKESVTGETVTRDTGYLYDLAGNVLVRSQANGTREISSYNEAGRRASQSTVNGTTPISNFLYSYDRGGNLLNIGEIYSSTAIPNRNVTNTYDRQNRLRTENVDTLDSSQAVTKSVLTTYTYNKGDNRTLKNVKETQGTTVVSNVTDLLVYGSSANGKNSNQLHTRSSGGQTTAYAYDASGNRLSKSIGGVTQESYGWDSKNRLVSLVQNSPLKTYSYGYDYRARRVIRNESAAGGENTTVSFSGGTSAFEKVGSTVKVEYVRGSDYGGGIGGIMYTVRAGVNSFNAYNSRGDVVAKSTAAGTVSWQATYESFGTRTTETGTNPDRQKANTKEEDPTGLLNEGFRYRDLVTGSFISRDPLGFVDGPNVYTYVRQNPWTSFDPEGLFEWKKVGSSLMNTLNGVGELATVSVAAIGEIAVGGSLGWEANGMFNQKAFAIAGGLVESGGKAIDAAHLAAGGNIGSATETALSILGDTPEEVVANGLLIVATEGIGRGLRGKSEVGGGIESTTARDVAETTQKQVQLNAPEVQTQLKSSALSKGDTYGHLTDHPSVGPGKDFTRTALDKAKADNLARNGGVMRDDITGEVMTPHPRTTKGSTVPPSAVQGDHVIPKKPKDPSVVPGSNSFKNLKLRRAEHNNEKSNN